MIQNSISKFVAYINCKIFIKKVEGVDELPDEGYILAANHSSYMDVWALMIVLYHHKKRYIRFLASKELVKDFYVRFLRSTLENPKSKPIFIKRRNNNKEVFKESAKTLKDGNIIGIFPEGGRSPDGKIMRGKSGSIRLAILSKKPIVPFGISGAFDLMPTGKTFPRIQKKVVINIGKPIYYKKYYSKNLTKKMLRGLTDNLMKEISQLCRK